MVCSACTLVVFHEGVMSMNFEVILAEQGTHLAWLTRLVHLGRCPAPLSISVPAHSLTSSLTPSYSDDFTETITMPLSSCSIVSTPLPSILSMRPSSDQPESESVCMPSSTSPSPVFSCSNEVPELPSMLPLLHTYLIPLSTFLTSNQALPSPGCLPENHAPSPSELDLLPISSVSS